MKTMDIFKSKLSALTAEAITNRDAAVDAEMKKEWSILATAMLDALDVAEQVVHRLRARDANA